MTALLLNIDTYASTGEILLRMALAVVIGGVIGFERERREKPAGLRTHMMVALGAATFTLIGFEVFTASADGQHPQARVDALRVVEGIIGGLGFLGAGTIIQSRGSVKGLTTAGSLWLTGALGVACGGGHYLIAGAAAGFGILILAVVGWLEKLSQSEP